MLRLVESPSAEQRALAARAWLGERRDVPVTIVSATGEAAADVARRSLGEHGAALGWERVTLGALAVATARVELARLGLVPTGSVALEAVAARIVHERQGALGRLGAIADAPGLPRALARTLAELRLASLDAARRLGELDPDLAALAGAFAAELDRAGLADRARTLAVATSAVAPRPRALLLVDVPIRSRAEAAFVGALARRATDVLATVPAGDTRTVGALTGALGPDVQVEHAPPPTSAALGRLQLGLFADAGPLACAPDEAETITVLSAPGESREAVEIARLIVAEAMRGTRLDEIAVLLRAPGYGAHLEEALRRANVPAYFSRGVRRPDPAGRALLALLGCRAEGLSARRFAEYLSLGEVPDAVDGAPPPPRPATEQIAAPDEEALGALLGEAARALDRPETVTADAPQLAEEDRATALGTLRAPRHWERLLVDAAVIGGKDRWERRLVGLRRKLEMDLEAYTKKAEDALAEGARRDLAALASLHSFAMPLVADLAALPDRASWGEWLAALGDLATRALRDPDRVLAVLAELSPMSRVGPVDLTEVRLVLERRLVELVVRSPLRRYGSVYVSTIEDARGLAFDVVFVPGLAEKIFPQKVSEDPLLLDAIRKRLDLGLATNDDRSRDERLALRLAVGAARRRVVLSYPRVDVEQARPRTPSFYGLEVLRVRDGELHGFEHLAEAAARRVSARIGWPAPSVASDAIDEAEYDLALLESVLKKPESECGGEARYLLSANAHLARALRFRWARWDPKAWRASDGLVEPAAEALAAIREHALDRRSFSPTALQNFAACPYRFLLSAVHKLAPRDEPEAIENLDPLTRGSLVHEVQFVLLTKLRERGLLPITSSRLEAARRLLEQVLLEVADEAKDTLNPAIERVWDDAIAGIAADLREWLRAMTDEGGVAWTPAHFELSFGLKDRRNEDPRSTDEPVTLDAGIRLRGSIDLVERHDSGRLRATDHKTGKVRAKRGETVIGQGEILQPVLYALAIEKLFPDAPVEGGRLYYCTSAGDFERVDIALTPEAREGAALVARTIAGAVSGGFLPAAPAKDACRYCDYRSVCGPYEEIRTKRKARARLSALVALRSHK